MEIKKYIESGVLESYVLGSASEEEIRQLLLLKRQYPEIQDALFQLETDLETLARHISIPPPPGMFEKIERGINALIVPGDTPPISDRGANNRHYYNNGNQFIEVEAESSQMRVHKAWRWIMAGVFVLGKIFLIAAIYYFLENHQAQEQIQQLKTELKQYHK
ncbi:hypothetical protein [Mucilaginibacter sp. UYCu711]|uniref:hypothetical protein n=1 Tax=Mucilaginibacter sp. UYCu711 TaxID=3156339 RepID=UPI003D24036E